MGQEGPARLVPGLLHSECPAGSAALSLGTAMRAEGGRDSRVACKGRAADGICLHGQKVSCSLL